MSHTETRRALFHEALKYPVLAVLLYLFLLGLVDVNQGGSTKVPICHTGFGLIYRVLVRHYLLA